MYQSGPIGVKSAWDETPDYYRFGHYDYGLYRLGGAPHSPLFTRRWIVVSWLGKSASGRNRPASHSVPLVQDWCAEVGRLKVVVPRIRGGGRLLAVNPWPESDRDSAAGRGFGRMERFREAFARVVNQYVHRSMDYAHQAGDDGQENSLTQAPPEVCFPAYLQ